MNTLYCQKPLARKQNNVVSLDNLVDELLDSFGFVESVTWKSQNYFLTKPYSYPPTF